MEVRPGEVRPWSDLSAVDLHDNHVTSRPAGMPERPTRRSLRRLWVDGHLTHYDSDVEPHAEVDRFAIRDVNIPTEESTTGCPVSLMEAA